MMACFWLNQNDTSITIPEAEEVNSITYYAINVKVGDVSWRVLHRYSEFYELHNVLTVDHGVSKDLLPPKKVIRNKCPAFIEDRRKALEQYLRNVINYLKRTMPRVFLEFLDFHLYDIFFLLQNLANNFYVEGDKVLSSTRSYKFTPLQLHSISRCFKNLFAATEQSDKRCELSHVLDFCSQLHHLTVVGSNCRYLHSSIVPNSLRFELSSFKVLESLVMCEVDADKIYSVANLRVTLEKLAVHRTVVTSVAQILLCDTMHKSVVDGDKVWNKIVEMDLSNNNLTAIDGAIKLVPNVRVLVFNQNKISCIPDLSFLTGLTHLSISNNLLADCEALNTKLGNLLSLNLSQNSIKTLRGLDKMYSLESLDVSCNKIATVEEISHLGDLPCLENFILTGNAVATTVDYRVKVLENFGERANEICLDNERPTQQELDKVSILRALRIVREGRTPDFNSASR